MEMPTLQREVMSKRERGALPTHPSSPWHGGKGKSWFLARGCHLTGTRVEAWVSYLSPYPRQG